MEIKEISFNAIDIIKNLWQEFNNYHIKKTLYFAEHFKEKTFEQKKNDLKIKKDVYILGVYKNSNIIGYSIASISCENVGEIDNIFITAKYRNKGIGQLLANKTFEWLERKKISDIIILVAIGNEKVLSFYKKFNFYPRNYRLMKV